MAEKDAVEVGGSNLADGGLQDDIAHWAEVLDRWVSAIDKGLGRLDGAAASMDGRRGSQPSIDELHTDTAGEK